MDTDKWSAYPATNKNCVVYSVYVVVVLSTSTCLRMSYTSIWKYVGIYGGAISRRTGRSFITEECQALKTRYQKGFKGDLYVFLSGYSQFNCT